MLKFLILALLLSAVWFAADRFRGLGIMATEVATLTDGSRWGVLRPAFHDGDDCSIITTIVRLPENPLEDYIPMSRVTACPAKMKFNVIEKRGVWVVQEGKIIIACGPLKLGSTDIAPCQRMFSQYQSLFACDEYEALKQGFPELAPQAPPAETCEGLKQYQIGE